MRICIYTFQGVEVTLFELPPETLKLLSGLGRLTAWNTQSRSAHVAFTAFALTEETSKYYLYQIVI